MAAHNELGLKGETLAKSYLKDNGYKILATNWRFEKSEVDIICETNNTMVFVEVKTRKTDAFGFPEESVSDRKQQKLLEAAEIFLKEKHFTGEIRFDVISIIFGKDYPPRIHHIKDAFFPYQE